MRPVTPAMFMRLPARMKNGTASSGKLSTPAIMSSASVTSAVTPLTRMSSSDDAAMAIATGTPSSISTRKPPSNSSMKLPFKTVVGAGTFEDRIALPQMLYGHLHRADEHQHEARQHGVIDVVLGKIDRGHGLVADDLDVDPDQLDGIAEEDDPDQINDSRQSARRDMRQIAVDQIDLDVPRQPHAHRGADEDHADQAVGRDLLGPGITVVEYVAGEELEEDGERHHPEDRQRDPVLESVDAEIDLGCRLLLEGVGDLVRSDLPVDFGGGHGVTPQTCSTSFRDGALAPDPEPRDSLVR